MTHQLQQLSNTLRGEVRLDDLHRGIYATDASVYRKLPLAVAYPKDEEDLKKLIRFATEENTSLIPRTAGTSLAGQCVGEGIVVDVSKHFTKIIEIDEKARTVTVQPGVIRDELNLMLEPFGLFFGPNTSTSNRCMIGGMVGNNSSGTTSIKYGVTRDKVVRLKTLLSDGSEAVFDAVSAATYHQKRQEDTLEGTIYDVLYKELQSKKVQEQIKSQFPKPEIHRRNTGYALDLLLENGVFDQTSTLPFQWCNLLCGSEGTLAFTTEITLQLDPLPPKHTAVVAAHYSALSSCLEDVNHVMQHDLYTCEMMDDVILDCTKDNKKYNSYRFFVAGSPKAILLLELRDATKSKLEEKIAALQHTLKASANSYGAPVLTGPEIAMALDLRKAGLGLLGNMVGDHKAVACIEDTAVALPDLPDFIREFTSIMDRYQQRAVYYAHAGAGELHLRPILNLKNKEGVALFREITTQVALLTKKYRGSFSGEHGDGIVRAEFLEMQIGTENFQLLKRIKKAFDPKNIFNPGKITDAWPMDRNLRTEKKTPTVATAYDFSDSKGIVRLAEKCNGSGDCRKTEQSEGAMCPSYHATRNEKDTTRARANMLREVLTDTTASNAFDSKALKEAFDLCISCKACASECPSNVDMATAKSEFLFQYAKTNGRSAGELFIAKSTKYNRWAYRFPRMANAMLQQKWIASLVKKKVGIATQRSLPVISTVSLNKLSYNTVKETNKKIYIYLFVDEFSHYLDANIVNDSIQLLHRLGYRVSLITGFDSARALLSKGFLEEAKIAIDRVLDALKDQVSDKSPLLGIEPSAILGFRDEFPRLAKDKVAAERLGQHCYLMEEFLAAELKRGAFEASQFTDEARNIKIHVHCHQKALSDQKSTFDLLNLPVNYKPTIIPSGCCGMAGSFGYEAEHYETSMKIGELRLFPAVRKADPATIIAANGTSCRHQIKDGTGRVALHPISILKNALKD